MVSNSRLEMAIFYIFRRHRMNEDLKNDDNVEGRLFKDFIMTLRNFVDMFGIISSMFGIIGTC